MRSSYERKLSAEEAREGYIMVLKDQLAFFPPVGEPFQLHEGTSSRTASVDAEDCVCRGPEKPHQHYSIRWKTAPKGSRISITNAGDGKYLIERALP
ncbi:MAG: hypothetical protein ABI577_15805 [bacterium]